MFYNPTTQAYVRDGEAFTHDDVQYPASWDKLSLGFVEVTTVGTREDDRYFWVSEELLDGVRTITNTPKSDEMIAALHKGQVDAKLTKVREVREAMLNRLCGIATALGDAETLAGFRAARLALLDITTDCPTDPTLVDDFIFSKYAAIIPVLPATLLTAFAGVDA